MEGEEREEHTETLTLFDYYWFHHLILLKVHPPPPPALPTPSPSLPSPPPSPPITRPQLFVRRHRRSLSDELSPSPNLQIHPPKLQTILSGKESAVGEEIGRFEVAGEERMWRRDGRNRRRRKKRIESSKSLSDLEFEELKGFMDLGFTFSDAETDPRLMSIVPGLQRLRAAACGDGESAAEEASSFASEGSNEAAISRPYLSEAWDAEEEEEENPLRNFRIPAVGEGVDLKDHLKFWAQAVASTVR